MKKPISILLLLILVSLLGLKLISKSYANSDTLLCRISNLLNRNNTIQLTCHGLVKSEVSIKWYSDDVSDKSVIKNGRETKKISNHYGPSYFLITLENGQSAKVGHFKTNNWYSHNYKFDITKSDQKYRVKFVAEGPNDVEYEKDFITLE